MEEVSRLGPGLHFGQDSLMTERDHMKRNATCKATQDGKVIVVVLTKNDFKRILREEERIIQQKCISEITQFDLFTHVSKRKLSLYYRLFYHAETKGCYSKQRN